MAAGMGEVDWVLRGRSIQIEARRMAAQFGVLIATAKDPLSGWSDIGFSAEGHNQRIDRRDMLRIASDLAQS